MAVDQKQINNEDLLQLAIRAARAGQTDGARVMLRQVVAQNRNNETAMLWLAKISRNPKERITWLNRVLDVNPDNKTARKALDRMEYKRAASENRMLVLYGAVAVIMIIVTLVVLLVVVF